MSALPRPRFTTCPSMLVLFKHTCACSQDHRDCLHIVWVLSDDHIRPRFRYEPRRRAAQIILWSRILCSDFCVGDATRSIVMRKCTTHRQDARVHKCRGICSICMDTAGPWVFTKPPGAYTNKPLLLSTPCNYATAQQIFSWIF